jgi:hypothetical protein
MAYDLFVSYSRKDKELVHEFVMQLKHKGFSVWIDWSGIKSGDKFKAEIVQAIEESNVVLFFSSASSNASDWVQKEISIATNRHKTIIPVKIDNSAYDKNIEVDLTLLDFVDYTNCQERQLVFDRLVRSIWMHISISEQSSKLISVSQVDSSNNIVYISKIKVLMYSLLVVLLIFIAVDQYVDHIHHRENKHRIENAEAEKAESEAKIMKIKAVVAYEQMQRSKRGDNFNEDIIK